MKNLSKLDVTELDNKETRLTSGGCCCCSCDKCGSCGKHITKQQWINSMKAVMGW